MSGTTRIDLWKPNGMSEENIENVTKSGSNFTPTFADHHILRDTNFNGHCLIKNNISITKKVINLYISYKLNPHLRNLNTNFTLNNVLFGSVKLRKNADLNNTSIAATAKDLILVQDFYSQMKALEKMSLFLELI